MNLPATRTRKSSPGEAGYCLIGRIRRFSALLLRLAVSGTDLGSVAPEFQIGLKSTHAGRSLSPRTRAGRTVRTFRPRRRPDAYCPCANGLRPRTGQAD